MHRSSPGLVRVLIARLFVVSALGAAMLPAPVVAQSISWAPRVPLHPGGRGLEAPPEAPPAEPSAGAGTSCKGESAVHDVYLHSGEFACSAVDLRIPGRGLDFVWARKYRSRYGPDTAQGKGWDFSYNVRIEASGTGILVHDGHSRTDLYDLRPGGVYTAEQFFREGHFEPNGSFQLIFADAGRWEFHPLDGSPTAGKIETIVDRSGNTISFAYDGIGRLITIVDTLGRPITVAYHPTTGRIQSVTDFAGRSVVYAHYQRGDADGSAGDLKSARSPTVTNTVNGNDFPAGKTTVYTYSKGFADDRLNHNLLTIRDPKLQIWLTNTYSGETSSLDLSHDRVVRQIRGNSGDIIDFVYVSIPLVLIGQDPESAPCLRAIVNDRVGNVREYFYDRSNRLVALREFTGRADPDQPTTGTLNRPTNKLRADDPDLFETSYAYNEDALVTQIVHPGGNVTQKVHELDLDPGSPWRSRGNLREIHRLPGTHLPVGDQSSLDEFFEYTSGFGGCCGVSFVTRHTDPRGNVTEHDYDSFGNRTHTDHRTGGGVEDWTYNGFGQVLTHTLPANGSGHRRVDAHTYHTTAPQTGYLQTEVIDSGGFDLTTLYTYDDVGNMLTRTDPRDNIESYTYNQLDQIVRHLSRPGGGGHPIETLTWYDDNDNVIRRDIQNRDDNGVPQANTHFSTIYAYEILNRLIRTCQERGSLTLTNTQMVCADMPLTERVTTEYAYDANRNQTHVSRPQAQAAVNPEPRNTVDTEYDERDLVFRTIRAKTDPLQSTDQTDYDDNANVSRTLHGIEDAGSPQETLYVQDGYDRRMAMTDAMGNVTTYHYDANGNMTSQQVDGQLQDVVGGPSNVLLSQATHQYDAMDRRTHQDFAHFDTETGAAIGDGQSTTRWTYANNSQLTSMTTDLSGHATNYAYDTANRRDTVSDAKLNSMTYGYDANSNVTSTVEVDKSDLGNPDQTITTLHTYDALDRLTQSVDNLTNSYQYGYDSRNNLVRTIDARWNHTRYEYDPLDRLVLTSRDMNDNQIFTDPADIVTTQTWDDSSRPTGQTDDNDHTTGYSYDALDRRTGTDYADCTTNSTAYDVHDNAIVTIDANGTTVNNTYDRLDRLTNRTVAVFGAGVATPPLGTSSELYRYDGLSRLIRAEDNDSLVSRGSASTSGYDSLSNVLRETQQRLNPAGPVRTVTAEYDGESNQTRLTHPLPGLRSIMYTYDLLDRPMMVNDDPPTGPPIATYAYIGPYRVERRDYPKANPAQTTRLTLLYDGIRRITGTLHDRDPLGAPTPVDHRFYDWDPNSNKMATHRPIPVPPEDRFYTYDAANRLVQTEVMVPPNPPSLTNYVLDGAGNRTSAGYTMNATLCTPGDYQMNQYTTTPAPDARSYDFNGNLVTLTNPVRTLTYDYRNQLVRHVSGAVTSTYRYDCLGRRIEKSVAGVITRFYYDGDEEIEEQNAADATTATYVFSKGSRSRLQMVRGGQQYYYHEDDLGSLLKVTNQSGSIAEGYAYGDFGHTTFFDQFHNPIGQSNIGNPWLFQALYFHSESGDYWNGHNIDTDAGRTNQRVSLDVWASDFGNPYTFAGNAPTSVTSDRPLLWADVRGMRDVVASLIVTAFLADRLDAAGEYIDRLDRYIRDELLPGRTFGGGAGVPAVNLGMISWFGDQLAAAAWYRAQNDRFRSIHSPFVRWEGFTTTGSDGHGGPTYRAPMPRACADPCVGERNLKGQLPGECVTSGPMPSQDIWCKWVSFKAHESAEDVCSFRGGRGCHCDGKKEIDKKNGGCKTLVVGGKKVCECSCMIKVMGSCRR